MTTLVLVFQKIENCDKTRYDTFYSNSEAETIINASNIDNAFESICATIIKSSDWIIDSVIDHLISISKYNPLAGSSYIRLPKELDSIQRKN